MTIQERIAKVLEEHGDWWVDTSGEDKSVHCDCGEPISEKHIMFPDELFLSHLAAVLAGVVAEAQAEAFDSGSDAVWDVMNRRAQGECYAKVVNPYREGA